MYIHIPAGKRSRKQQDLLFLTQLGLFQDPGVLAITDLLSPSPPQIELLGHAHRAPVASLAKLLQIGLKSLKARPICDLY
jgi:hypothetical protein